MSILLWTANYSSLVSCNHGQIGEDYTYLTVVCDDALPSFVQISRAMILPIIYIGFEIQIKGEQTYASSKIKMSGKLLKFVHLNFEEL